jgi:hypothetical protein
LGKFRNYISIQDHIHCSSLVFALMSLSLWGLTKLGSRRRNRRLGKMQIILANSNTVLFITVLLAYF